ncbi:MAG: amidohydrolase family protein [Actinobacteria bacterium]|nr:amidohydrolase family protein [Actinomycetota bacterium]
MKKIDFETHFVTQEWVDALWSNPGFPRFERDPETKVFRLVYHPAAKEPFGDALLNRLLDLGADRLAAMDAKGIDTSVISLTAPGVEQFDPSLGSGLARRANDALAEAVSKFPDRYQGFAALAVKDVDGAVRELERAVKELGLIGWKTHSNYGDSYLDEKRYWPILAKAEELNVPIYLHPTTPKIPEFWTYGVALAGPPFGFGIETSLAAMRLVLSGAFDAFPNLKLVLGHLGEGLPFHMQRMNWAFERPHAKADKGAVVSLQKKPSEYFLSNVMVTTSGNYLPAAFRCTHDTLGIERIMLGTDYPYEDLDECFDFLEGLGLKPDESSLVFGGNAVNSGLIT